MEKSEYMIRVYEQYKVEPVDNFYAPWELLGYNGEFMTDSQRKHAEELYERLGKMLGKNKDTVQ